MKTLIMKFLAYITVLLLTVTFTGCRSSNFSQVVVYTSVDQVYSEKIFALFEQKTGIKVMPVYDIEANKTVGLANRLIAEKDRPLADVFWNGEITQTMQLKKAGVLDSVMIAAASDLPAGYVDPEGYWYAFGGRGRVILYDKTRITEAELPQKMADLPGNKYIKQAGIAYPVFGTTLTHAAAIYAKAGNVAAKQYFTDLWASGIHILDGNSVVKDQVSAGNLVFGLTDTDDALSVIKKDPNLGLKFLDQEDDGVGTLIIPNTAALIKGAPHKAEAVIFLEFLLSAQTEQVMTDEGWIQLPVHTGIKPDEALDGLIIKRMDLDFEKIFEKLEIAAADMKEIFIR